jgi:hypothetical protein
MKDAYNILVGKTGWMIEFVHLAGRRRIVLR